MQPTNSYHTSKLVEAVGIEPTLGLRHTAYQTVASTTRLRFELAAIFNFQRSVALGLGPRSFALETNVLASELCHYTTKKPLSFLLKGFGTSKKFYLIRTAALRTICIPLWRLRHGQSHNGNACHLGVVTEHFNLSILSHLYYTP